MKLCFKVDTANDRTYKADELLKLVLELASKFVANGITRGTTISFYTDDKQLGLNAISLIATQIAGATYTAGKPIDCFYLLLTDCNRN